MFPGGKGKTFQQIINLMPPHRCYVEAFLGSGAVIRNKLPAIENIGNDLNKGCLQGLQGVCSEVYNEDAVSLIQRLSLDSQTLLYCDPPYVRSTRRKKKIYKYEYTDEDHEQLLDVLTKQSCMVMISGYESDLYSEYLKSWNSTSFSSQTHNGVRTEHVWFNFDVPTKLHDSRFLGTSFRERQTIKRRQQRLQRRFLEMDPVERSAMMEWLNNEFPQEGKQL